MAVAFDAANQQFYRAAGLFDYNSAYTVMGWFWPTASGFWRTLFGLTGTNDNADYDWLGLAESGGAVAIDSSAGGSGGFNGSAAGVTLDAWNHIALRRNSSTSIQPVVGGVAGTAVTPNVSGRAALDRLALTSQKATPANILHGRIAHVKVWTAALTDDEIAAEMYGVRPLRLVDLWGWWPVWSPSDVVDYSGNGRDLSTTGTITVADPPPVSWGAPIWVVQQTGGAMAHDLAADGIAAGTPDVRPAEIVELTTQTELVARYLATSPVALWPLSETSGTTADNAEGTAARDGTYVGGTVGGEGVLPTGKGFTSNGTAGYVNVSSAAGQFSGSVGTLVLWFKPAARSVWTDSTSRRLFSVAADAQNYLLVQRNGAVGHLVQVEYRAGNVSKVFSTVGFGLRATWSMLAVTWSKASDRVRLYLDGVQIMGDLTGLGTWSGTATAMYIAAANTTPTQVWNGQTALVGLWDRELTPDETLELAQLSPEMPASGERLTTRYFGLGGTPAWSPDGNSIVYDRKDASNNIQVYRQPAIGGTETCLTSPAPSGAPAATLHSGWMKYHPTADWATVQVEISGHPLTGDDRKYTEPVRGLYNDIWLFKPSDLTGWTNLTNYGTAGPVLGVLDVNFSADGTRMIWAEKWAAASQGYPWGKWRIVVANFNATTGALDYANRTTYTPDGDSWYASYGEIEPGVLVVASSLGWLRPFTLDIYEYDTSDGTRTYIENSAGKWDEHGHVHDGTLTYSSSRDYPDIDAAAIASGDYTTLKGDIYYYDGAATTEKLTHLNDPRFPESWDEPLYPHAQSTNPDGTALVFARHAHGASYGVEADWRRVYVVYLAAGTHALTAAEIATAATTVGSPALGQVHGLAATALDSATPTLDAPALGQTHGLTATGISAATPTVADPTLGQTHALVATGAEAGAPQAESPVLGQVHILATGAVELDAPQVAAAVVGQVHALTADVLATGIPAVGSPSMTGEVALEAIGAIPGAPVLDMPVLGQIHALDAAAVTVGAPQIPSATLGQIHLLAATGLATAAPTLGTPVLAEGQHILTAADLAAGAPTLDTPALGQVHGLVAGVIVAGDPALDAPALGQAHALSATGASAGAALLEAPALVIVTPLVAVGVDLGAPVAGSPSIGQTHALMAVDVATEAPTVGGATPAQVHALTAAGVTVGAWAITQPSLTMGAWITPSARTLAVAAEDRTLVVAAENRIIAVGG